MDKKKPPLISGEQLSEEIQQKAKKWSIVNPEFIEDIANISIEAQRDDTWQKAQAIYEPLIQQAKREMIEEIEKASTLQFNSAYGVKIFLKRWQSLKSKYLKEEHERQI